MILLGITANTWNQKHPQQLKAIQCKIAESFRQTYATSIYILIVKDYILSNFSFSLNQLAALQIWNFISYIFLTLGLVKHQEILTTNGQSLSSLEEMESSFL